MFKKVLYPFTDWNWLKIPLVSMAGGGCFLFAGLATFVSAYMHRDHVEAAEGAVMVGYFAFLLAYMVLFLTFYGYLVRVCRQPAADKPDMLPDWSGVGRLCKDGFLSLFSIYVWSMALGLVVAVVFYSFAAVVTGVAAGLHHYEWSNAAIVAGVTGAGFSIALYLVLLVVLFTTVGLATPLMIARYAYTGRVRHLFSIRWAWNAFTVAPGAYLARVGVWGFSLMVVTILTPLTAGGAYILGMLFLPIVMINSFYMVGDYYNTYLND